MQNDMLLLAERLVVALESMSQDVRNISAYVYDLSYSVSQLVNRKREKEEEEKLPSGSPAAGSKFSWQNEQQGGTSVSHIDDLQHKEISDGKFSSINNDCTESSGIFVTFTEGTKVEELSESEENSESSHMYNISGNGRKSMRSFQKNTLPPADKHCAGNSSSSTSEKDVAEEAEDIIDMTEGWIPLTEGSLNQLNQGAIQLSFMAQSASSSIRTPSVEAIGINTEQHWSKNSCSSEHVARFLQNRQCQVPVALEGEAEGLVAGVQEGQHIDPRVGETRGYYGVASEVTEIDGRKKAFQSSTCKELLPKHSKLAMLMKEHVAKRPFKCKQCWKCFKTKGNLSSHLKFHEKEKPFKCSWCEKAFFQNSDLRRHVRIHSGERPFTCSHCGKSFAQKCNLTTHMISHSK